VNAADEVERLLKADGAVLVRSKKHQVWRLSNGKTLVISSTASDGARAARNQLRDLRRLLRS